MNKNYPYLKPGDTIICKDCDNMVETMIGLEFAGVSTDFNFDDPHTYKLVVVEVRDTEK